MRQAAALATAAVITLGGCTGSTTPEATDASSPSSPAPTLEESSATPSTATEPSPTESAEADPPAPDAPSFADVNGRWCLADDPTECVTIALPGLVHDDHPEFPEYVYPAGTGDPGDPSSWSYAGMAPGTDGCFETAVGPYPPGSGAAFLYCPAGAVTAKLNDLSGDPSVDRVFMTQQMDVMPYHRAAG